MAIRHRPERKNKPYLVYWKNPFTEKIESKAFETKAEAEKHNAFISYQLKYEREAFRRDEVEAAKPQKPQSQTLETVFYLYLKERNFDRHALGAMLSGINGILAKYGETNIKGIDKTILADMQNMLMTGANGATKGTTVRRRMGIIKAVIHWAHRKGYIDTLPIFPISPKDDTAKFVPPTAEEISKILEVAPEHLQRAIILGFMFGVRVGPSELLRLRWSDIDLVEKVIRVPNAKKGNKDPWREVPIRDSLLPIFQRWHEADVSENIDYVITYHGKPVKEIRTAWRKALQNAGITRYIRPYDLRHAFASEAIEAGTDYGTVAALMGHTSPVMVMKHYQHIKTKQKLAAVEKIPQPAGLERLV